jgi:hypothetical protein
MPYPPAMVHFSSWTTIVPHQNTYRPCTDEEFFVRHYPRLVTLVDEFTRTWRQALAAGDARHTLLTMLEACNAILSEALAVAGTELPQSQLAGAPLPRSTRQILATISAGITFDSESEAGCAAFITRQELPLARQLTLP